jgi:hypothetical protein
LAISFLLFNDELADWAPREREGWRAHSILIALAPRATISADFS